MFLWDESEGWPRINLNSRVILESTDPKYVVDADEIVDWVNVGMVINLVFFPCFSLLL